MQQLKCGTNMAESFLRASVALKELQMQLTYCKSLYCEKESGPFASLRKLFSSKPQLEPWMHTSLVTKMNEFEVELRFLITFLSYIHKWSDADKVAHNLRSLAIKIETATQEIAKFFWNAQTEKWGIKSPSKLYDAVCKYLQWIALFKPEIVEAYDQLSSHLFQSPSSSKDFQECLFLVGSICKNLQAFSEKISVSDPLKEQIATFKDSLAALGCFLGSIPRSIMDTWPQNPKVQDRLTYVGNLVIQAAHLSCLCWFREMDPSMANIISIMLLDLQKKIDATSPEFLETNLAFLETLNEIVGRGSEFWAELFVKYLLNGTKHGVFEDLMLLISIVIDKQKEFKESVQMQSLLADVKAAVYEVGSFNHMLGRENENDGVLFRLQTKNWLTEAEVFLMEQLNGGAIFLSSVKGQMEAFSDRLRDLRKYFVDSPPEDSTENGKQILTFIEVVDRTVTWLFHSFHAKEITESRVINTLFKLLLKIVLYKAESCLLLLLNRIASLPVLVKDQVTTLYKELKFLTMLVTVQPEENTENEKLILTHIDSVARDMISLYYSFFSNKITEEMITKMNLMLSDLLDEINLVKSKLKEIYLQVPRSNFPKTNVLGFIDFLLRKLKELLNNKPEVIAYARHQIETLLGELDFLRSFLQDFVERLFQYQELQDLGRHVIDVAYVSEYVIDLIVVGNGATLYHMSIFHYLLEEITLVKVQIAEICEKNSYEVEVHNVAQGSRHILRKTSAPRIDEVLVDLSDQMEVIIDRLTRGSLQRDTISIVGMPGIGKTTMAKRVFYNPKVTYHFHIRAWCGVSQVYRKRDLLLDILNNITELTENMLQMADEDLDLRLYQKLKEKRYLIVLDDMWNTGAWDSLQSSFPNDENGSRILITSRLHDVALKVKPDSEPHLLRLLSDDESWHLLQRKIFFTEGCPEKLLEIGKQIAKNCKGLPLAVVAIAGLLERTDRSENWWKQILESLSTQIVDDPQTRCMDILEMSYKHLPNYLRECFLYFGIFIEDKDIPVRKLIWLWIAEGFVEKIEAKSLEDLAEDYLSNLIGRSLVMVSKRRSNGGVKACRIHDLLRDLCQLKAKEEKFFRLITRYDEPYASFDRLDYGSDFDDCHSPNPIACEEYRLCICAKRKHFVVSRPFGPFVRSLLFFATADKYPTCPYDIMFICHNFRLLRVLDMECINMGISFPTGIVLLLQLRYLAVAGDIESIPSSIANLWNLESLLVKGLKGKVVLPATIWCMASLRHLHVNNHVVFSLEDEDPENSSHLYNLVTLSSASLSNGEEIEKIIRRMPNLQKMRCIFFAPQDGSGNCKFPGLDFLTQLESLKIFYYGRASYPHELNFPRNLKKLTLSNFRLPWSHISAIGKLPNLEVLKLLNRAFEGQIWEMTEGEFLNLKFLKLDTLNIIQWNACNDHLPNLQHLLLQSCEQLEEVPSAFAEISTLQVIEVNGCGHCADELVTRIDDEGIEGIRVLINHSDADFRS